MKLRLQVAALVGAVALVHLGGAARASTYSLTLNPILADGSTLYGNGTLIFSGVTVPSTGLFDVPTADITTASISIETSPVKSITFNLLGDISSLVFLNGQLNALTAGPVVVYGDDLFVSGTSAEFVDGQFMSFDSITASNVSATPLPPTWTMLLAGLAGLGFLLSQARKKEAAHVPLA